MIIIMHRNITYIYLENDQIKFKVKQCVQIAAEDEFKKTQLHLLKKRKQYMYFCTHACV